MSQYNVLIVGAGRIGATFDTPQSQKILTHAHAFSTTPGFAMVGFVDTNIKAAQRAAAVWGGTAFEAIDHAFSSGTIDVVCVTASDEFHYEILKQLTELPVKIVFAEKPLTKTIVQAQEIVALYDSLHIPLLVNYTRRFVPEFQVLRQEIQSGRYGKLMAGTGFYGKGLIHNGSHLVDLLRFFFGDIVEAQASKVIADFYDDDPTIAGTLVFKENMFCTLHAIDCSLHTMFECDLVFERARVRIIDSGFGLESYAVRQNPLFQGYRNLKKISDKKTSMDQALLYAAQHLHNVLDKQEMLVCSGYDALQVMKACARLKDRIACDSSEQKTYPGICM